MNKAIYILALIFLLGACSKLVSQGKSSTEIRNEYSLSSSDEQLELNNKTAQEVNKNLSPNCLTTSDQKEIDNFIIRLKAAINNNDINYIFSVISAPLVGKNIIDIDLVKEYFDPDLIEESLKPELEIDERFSPPDENGCCYYIVGRNFPALEYSVVFDLTKRDSKITISTITLFG